MGAKKYLSYFLNPLLNPLQILRTKKVLQVNPTVISDRKEPEKTKLAVYDYDAKDVQYKELESVSDSYPFIETAAVSWINVDV